MFLENFNPPQLKAFAALARRIMVADGHQHESELAMLARVAEEFGLDDSQDLASLVWEPSAFAGEPASRAVLIEAAAVALVDGHLDEAEADVLSAVAADMGLTPGTAMRALDFAQRLSSLSDEVTRFVAEA